ncbi:Ubiquitin Carboxyl-Terminal Hydrolase 38 [Manis pentadactyla]|nr:Ubiquitin Carboxyl-Terminal Hydrolase 38 [Manis pentadactyla]
MQPVGTGGKLMATVTYKRQSSSSKQQNGVLEPVIPIPVSFLCSDVFGSTCFGVCPNPLSAEEENEDPLNGNRCAIGCTRVNVQPLAA